MDLRLSTEAQLVEILTSSIFHATGLRDALQAEHAALTEQDVEKLLQAIEDKGLAVQELQVQDQRRDALCAQFGATSGPEQMNGFLSRSLNPEEIESAWTSLLTLAEECSALNKANGAIIRMRKQHIENGLSLIRGDTTEQSTYARDGSSPDTSNQRTLTQV